MSFRPFFTARWSGVEPSGSGASTTAPLDRSIRAISTLPPWAALWKGVRPDSSFDSMGTPLFRANETAPVTPEIRGPMERIFFEKVSVLEGLGARPELLGEPDEAVPEREGQRGFVVLVPDVELGAVGEQPFDDILAAGLGDIEQGSRPLFVQGVDVRAVLDQDVEEAEIAGEGRFVKGGLLKRSRGS